GGRAVTWTGAGSVTTMSGGDIVDRPLRQYQLRRGQPSLVVQPALHGFVVEDFGDVFLVLVEGRHVPRDRRGPRREDGVLVVVELDRHRGVVREVLAVRRRHRLVEVRVTRQRERAADRQDAEVDRHAGTPGTTSPSRVTPSRNTISSTLPVSWQK